MLKEKAVVLTHVSTENEPYGYYLNFVSYDVESLKFLLSNIVSDTLQYDLEIEDYENILPKFKFNSICTKEQVNGYSETFEGINITVEVAYDNDSLAVIIKKLQSMSKLRNNRQFMKISEEILSEQDTLRTPYYEQLIAYAQDLIIGSLWAGA